MANKLTDMSKIRKAIKCHCSGKSKLFISNYLSLSRNTVKKYIALFDALGLNLEDLEKKTDADLENLFSQPRWKLPILRWKNSIPIFLKWNAT